MANMRRVFGLRAGISLIFFISSFIFYSLMTYGGVRSADSEIVFRTAESLATQGTFTVSEGFKDWDFGLVKGRHGRRYAWFGPGEELMLTPIVKISQHINKSK